MQECYPVADVRHYTQLETGARWLAARSQPGTEREVHLAHAERYSLLRLDAAEAEGR
jgi:hypothetical protein